MKIKKIFISFVLYTIVLNLVSCTNLNTNSKQTTGFDTQAVSYTHLSKQNSVCSI